MSAKVWGLIILLVLLVIFSLQNTQAVDVKFLFWGFSTSAVVTILLSFIIGFLAGWLTGRFRPQDKTI
jgi:uncharacterized integral membrane protein